jgi:phosphoglucosamine mutase
MTRKYFGTDGIRGRVGTFPITPDFVLKLGWAVGRVFARDGRKLVLIGKDTRISGYMFESALEAGLSAAGVDVLLLGPMPTPAIAYLTRTFRADAGIVISASHNAFHDNGIKFFSAEGTKLPDEVEQRIEAQLDLAMTTVCSEELGKVRRVNDAAGRYIEFCKSTASGTLNLAGLKVVVDCANGAGYHIAPKVFRELGAKVYEIGTEPDGLNINENCGATAPQQLQEKVIEVGADLGIALDGDGDRLILVDHKGEVVDGDEILFIIAQALHQSGELNGGVVGTLMTNLGLEQALAKMDIPFVRAKVGDRYVLEQLAKHGWNLGGEGSGHIVCRSILPTGDATVAAVQVLKAVANSHKPIHELKQGMQKLPQRMINVRLEQKVDIAASDEVTQLVAAAELELADKGRVLLRPSGTEPVVRVMVEGSDLQQVNQVCEQLAVDVEKALKALES